MARFPIGSRFRYGFLVASLACLFLGQFLQGRSQRDIVREREERSLLIAAHALADVVERAAGSGDVRRAVVRFAGFHPQVRGVRVVTLAAREMTASTLEEGGPRPLEPAERPLFETAEKLRSAVARNRAARGHERAEEMARQWLDYQGDAVVSVTVPFERGGQVVGAVQVESFPDLRGSLQSFAPTLNFFLMIVLVRFLAQERRALAVGTAILLFSQLSQQAGFEKREIDSSRKQMAEHIAHVLVTEEEQAKGILSEIGAPPSRLDPLSWDTDSRGRRFALTTSPGEVDPAKLAMLKKADNRRSLRTSLAVALVGFAILGFAGFYRTGREEPEVPEPVERS